MLIVGVVQDCCGYWQLDFFMAAGVVWRVVVFCLPWPGFDVRFFGGPMSDQEFVHKN